MRWTHPRIIAVQCLLSIIFQNDLKWDQHSDKVNTKLSPHLIQHQQMLMAFKLINKLSYDAKWDRVRRGDHYLQPKDKRPIGLAFRPKAEPNPNDQLFTLNFMEWTSPRASSYPHPRSLQKATKIVVMVKVWLLRENQREFSNWGGLDWVDWRTPTYSLSVDDNLDVHERTQQWS